MENGLPALSSEELRRYSRHLKLPEVGLDGQRKLKNARVLIVGTGGLGAPAGMYLAAAGIGHMGVVDFDVVDQSNLQRQIIHGTSDVGRLKIESAEDRLHDINPNVQIETYGTQLSAANALDIIRDYDIIVDCTDNFPTRYLINDACILLKKPNVYGSIFRFEGQASVFGYNGSACYRCLYPQPPSPGSITSCAEGGVFGVLPGIIGSIQATEVIKIVLGIGNSLANRLLLFDALEMRFSEVQMHKDPACPVCGEHPTIQSLLDYEAFCGMATINKTPENDNVSALSAIQLKEWIDAGKTMQIIDVREPFEYAIAQIPNTKLIPLGQITERMNEIDPSRPTVVMCHGGIRSAHAINQLKLYGFTGQLINLTGGIQAWSEDVDPNVPEY